MKRLCIIQPLLSNYSHQTFRELAQHCQVDLVFSPTPSGTGFGDVPIPPSSRVRYFVVPTVRPFGERLGMIQIGVGKYIRRERPDAIMIFGNPRYLSFWSTLLWGRLLRIPVHVHGHGVFKKRHIGTFYRLMMTLLLKLATSYICYAPMVRQSFLDHAFPGRKLTVADNSLTNLFPVQPHEKRGDERGILFIGRVRQGSNIALLVRVIERLRREDGLPLTLHVIGAGEETHMLRSETSNLPWVVLHGQIFDQQQIRYVSLNCFLGCYPGNAGLSVEHLMSLSLPVITHDDLPSHQGPEPSFVRNGIAGLLYDHTAPEESLYQAIRSLAGDPHLLTKMQRSAFQEYLHLTTPPLSARLWSILDARQHVPETALAISPVTEPAGSREESAPIR
jgi:glycosyltransferase involved in cell wall biosynthesis